MQRGTYHGIAPDTVGGRSRGTTVVGGAVSPRNGQVSIAADGDDALVLATPAGSHACVFARDEPVTSKLSFVTAAGASCRADAAPDGGWSSG